MQPYEIKPNKTSFVTYSFIVGFLIWFGILIIAIILLRKIPILIIPAVIIFILWNIYRYYSLNVKYQKESYTFLENKIIRKSGGVFSDREVELILKNTTNIGLNIPYIQNKLFGTGNLYVQSAGSGGIEIYLTSIDQPEKIYDYILALLKHNGFKLTKSKLVYKEKPASIGVFFEVFKNFFGAIFFIIIIILNFTPESESFNIFTFISANAGITILLGLLFLVGLFIRTIFQFLDLEKRVYEIYTDTIVFSEGFLNKNYAIIPLENLADSTVKQSFVDKIFGLYDVAISCQGSSQEILFKNLANGPKIEQTIDNLIQETKSPAKTKSGIPEKKADKKIPQANLQGIQASPANSEEKSHSKKSYDTPYTAEFAMEKSRTIIPGIVIILIFLILIPFLIIISLGTVFGKIYFFASPLLAILIPISLSGIIIFIKNIIKLNSTKYFIRQNSIEEQFDFMSMQHKQFTIDKITGIIFHENLLDKYFNTCTIEFWSIGSAETIKFTNIKKSEGLYKQLLGKAGLQTKEPIYNIESKYTFNEMLKANIRATILFSVASIGLIIAGIFISFLFLLGLLPIILGYIIAAIYRTYYYQNSKLIFYKDCLYFKRGLVFEEYYFTSHKNIKDIMTTQYPFSSCGSIMFNVAGERLVMANQKKQIISNAFTIKYAEKIETKNELIDMIFYQRPNAKQTAYIEQNIEKYISKPALAAKSSIANTLLINIGILLFIMIFLFIGVLSAIGLSGLVPFTAALILILIPTIGFTIWSIKMRAYIIQPHRVIAKWGIFYKSQVSILFRKIDHINFYQGVLNKAFGNGNITINTVGSSMPEMIIRDIPNHKEFYEKCRQKNS